MEQLPSNSHSAKREPAAEEPKKIEKVVKGEVVTRKRPWSRRLSETFLANRADKVGEVVFWDVLVPALKNMVADGTASFVDRMIFGDGRPPRGRASSVGQSIGTYVSGSLVNPQQTAYHRVGAQPSNAGIPLSYRARATHDFKEIVIPTRVEAEAVLDQLFRRIVEYNAVTVADFYELCGVTPNFTDDRYGWSDIRGSGVLRVRDGFVLDLPRPEPLD